MNYGFIVMPWKASLPWGAVMLGLFVIQIAANLCVTKEPPENAMLPHMRNLCHTEFFIISTQIGSIT